MPSIDRSANPDPVIPEYEMDRMLWLRTSHSGEESTALEGSISSVKSSFFEECDEKSLFLTPPMAITHEDANTKDLEHEMAKQPADAFSLVKNKLRSKVTKYRMLNSCSQATPTINNKTNLNQLTKEDPATRQENEGMPMFDRLKNVDLLSEEITTSNRLNAETPCWITETKQVNDPVSQVVHGRDQEGSKMRSGHTSAPVDSLTAISDTQSSFHSSQPLDLELDIRKIRSKMVKTRMLKWCKQMTSRIRHNGTKRMHLSKGKLATRCANEDKHVEMNADLPAGKKTMPEPVKPNSDVPCLITCANEDKHVEMNADLPVGKNTMPEPVKPNSDVPCSITCTSKEQATSDDSVCHAAYLRDEEGTEKTTATGFFRYFFDLWFGGTGPQDLLFSADSSIQSSLDSSSTPMGGSFGVSIQSSLDSLSTPVGGCFGV